MQKSLTLLLISLATVAVSTPCMASEPETSQVIAVSRPNPVVVDDAVIQKAVQVLVKQQSRTLDLKKKYPNKIDNPLGYHPVKTDKILILGGSEAIPM